MVYNGYFSITENHIPELKEALEEQVIAALEACGVQAVGHTVANITSIGAVDTGLLRNSITYAMDGKAPKKTSYHAAYGSGRNSKGQRYSYRNAKAGAVGVGRYKGTAPEDNRGTHTVYIGTNVYYAPYVEMGYTRTNGRKVAARPYLRPAIEDNKMEYIAIIKKIISGK